NQPGFIEPPTPEGWTLSITPHELTEYLFCGCAFINYLLAFFSDRRIPPPSPLVLTRPIRPEELPADFDVVASDEKPPKAIIKLGEGKSNEKSDDPEQSLCPEKYVSFPSRVTFFWVTKLIITGYRNTLQMGHLWAVDSKNLSAQVVPVFLRSIYKYLRVDISGELDTPHTANSQFSVNWPTQDTVSSISDDQKSGIADSNLNTGNCTTSDEATARRSTFAEFSVAPEGVAGGKGKFEKRQRTLSGAPDIGKKPTSFGSTTLLPNVQIRISARSSKSKPSPSSKKGSSVGDVEAGLLGSDLLKQGKPDGAGSGKAVGGKREPQKTKCGLAKALIYTYGFRMFVAGLFKIGHDVCLLSGPVLFKYLLQSMNPDSNEPVWHGYCYAVLMFMISFVQSIMLHQYFRAQNLVGMDMRTAIISAVYRKSLRLSAASRGESTTGEITNLMSIDAGRFHMLMFNIHVLWSAPFQVSLAIYLLWQQLGPSVLAGVLILLIMIPINTLVAKKSKALQEKQIKTTDKRIKLISEILNGIRVLKLYAWEPSFIAEVANIRRTELQYLRKFLYLDCSTTFVFSCAPTLFALSSFATFIMSSPDNHLTAEKIFVSLALLNIMRFPLFMFPTVLSNLVQTLVSVRRLTKFLVNTELDPATVSHEDTPGVAAVIENGTLAWAPDAEPSLHNITAYFPEGQSTAIVGRVGCGKTSLLNALLGNMELVTGRINIKGRIALVSQQAWIFNATLRDNILFHRPYDPERYAKIIKACALETDIKLLPDADLTDIGDKGVNLSGGQKQRVSIARACYAEADVYLFDDPLAAVDAHVATHLLTQVFGRGGLLSDKTRIIATHHPNAIAAADRVAVLESGRLVEFGSYANLTGRPTSRLNAFLKSEELKKRLLSESEGVSESVAASAPVASLCETVIRRRYRTSTDSTRPTSIVGPGDLAELTPMEESVESEAEIDTDEDLKSTPSAASDKERRQSEGVTSKEKGEPQERQKRSTEETSAIGRVKFALFWLYIRHVGICSFIMGVILLLLSQISWLGNNLWLADWSKEYVNSSASNYITPQPKMGIGLRLGIYSIISVSQFMFTLTSCLLLAVGSVHAAKRLHHNLLSRILHVPTSFFDLVPQGRIINRFSNDVSIADHHLMISFRSMTNTLFSCLVTFALSVVPSAYILIFLALLIAFYAFMQILFVATRRQLQRLDSVSRSPIFSHFAETLLGAGTIRAYGLCDLFVGTNDARVDANNRAMYGVIVANRWLSMILETVGNLLTLATSVAFVTATRGGSLNAGLAGLVISYTLNVTQGLSWFVRMASELETNVVSVERIHEYSELAVEAPWNVPDKQPPPQWPEGRIEFINYSTRYREDLDLVLKSISVLIRPSEKIGIVGRTGSGKSSLVLALFRIIEPTEGEIRLDGINISEIGLHDIRGRITLIPQDPVLFSGTLRFNLDPFDNYTDEAVWEALSTANLRSFVKEASNEGLSMPISEGGGNLSQGQRQLVCLARALLRRSKILVLDEATAAVDPHTDRLIQQAVRTEFADSTVLTIAHRLNTILDYDRIMVLDAGHLAEIGTPCELAARPDSIFRGMLKESNLLKTVLGLSKS
ncbi:unnamed protein product, partial [Hymenolepis diminuta]